jgi:hypothetical protein
MATLLAVASLLPLTIAAVIDIREARERLLANTTAVLAARADQLAGELDAFHQLYRRAAAILARLPDVAALSDPTDTATLATEPALVGRPLASLQHVRDALDGSAVTFDVFVAGPEAGNEPTIAYLAPVRGVDGAVTGLAALWVRATALWDLARAANERAGPRSFAVLFGG